MEGEGESLRVKFWRVEGIHCSFCESTIKDALSSIKGVKDFSVSLAHEELMVKYDPRVVNEDVIKGVLSGLGYRLLDPSKTLDLNAVVAGEKRRLVASILLSLPIGVLMVFMRLYGEPNLYMALAAGLLASVNFFLLGGKYLVMAYNALRRRILNQHVLMAATALSGLTGGLMGLLLDPRTFPPVEFFGVASFVTTYHILGGFAGAYVRKRSSEAVKRLLEIQPRVARVRRGSEWAVVPVDQVGVGDLVLVKPGERVPLDGVVVEGYSTVDESIVTGESMPVDKAPGSEVLSGSLNLTGYLVVRVTRRVEESFVARIARHMREVRALKPGVIQLLDRVLGFYVPWVFVSSVIALLAWLSSTLVTGYPGVKESFYAFTAVLVMGYPCALGMSVPLAMVKGGYLAAERGILFRGSEAFHVLSSDPQKVVVAFDKTGTLTRGRVKVARVASRGFLSEDELLRLASCLEVYSNHPIAKAIVDEATSKLGSVDCGSIRGFTEVPGGGVSGLINSNHVAVGKLGFLESRGFIVDESVRVMAEGLMERGFTVVGVGVGGAVEGLIALSDELKDDASEAVGELKRMGFKVAMLTGDSPKVAERVARELGIDFYMANLKPSDKTEWIREMRRKGFKVVMVGDGVNDAPALTIADVGIALSTGSDISVESADVVIMGDKVSRVVDAIRIARYMYKVTKENLALAFIYNGMGVPLAAIGLLKPYWAMVAMIASVTSILANTFARKPRYTG
ncbi:MAG: cation-translocating P-type ATPase [Desulfurococcales archaeon]|nr:cation-translocating P-type ATPase [Desulfurococcales archaeon]